MRKSSVGRAESEVLRYVADRHPITVREVAEHFAATRGLAKTTVLSVMERLREKGFLTREPGVGGFCYAPTRSKERLMRDLVRDFVQEMLGGSLEPFTAYLAEASPLTRRNLPGFRRSSRRFKSRKPEKQHRKRQASPKKTKRP